MITILAIVGESGVGKTYASLKLKEWYGIPHIVSSTTRAKRPGEVDGIDHWFKTSQDIPEESKRLAYTQYGGYQYWAEHPDPQGPQVISYVIDEQGLLELKNKYSDRYDIRAFYIKRPNRQDISEERKNRDKSRQKISDIFYDVILLNEGTLEDFDQLLKYVFEPYVSNRNLS